MNRRDLIVIALCIPIPAAILGLAQKKPDTHDPYNGGKPEKLKIRHDDFYAKYVGYSATGSQFFLTSGFAWGKAPAGRRRDFMTLYLFNADGTLEMLSSAKFPAAPTTEFCVTNW
jgi:hypothetical protein